jgi:hypothetical protein
MRFHEGYFRMFRSSEKQTALCIYSKGKTMQDETLTAVVMKSYIFWDVMKCKKSSDISENVSPPSSSVKNKPNKNPSMDYTTLYFIRENSSVICYLPIRSTVCTKPYSG